MREIKAEQITETIAKLCIEANKVLPDSLVDCISCGYKNEEKDLPKNIMGDLLLNLNCAKELDIPICQDTGMAVVFAVPVGIMCGAFLAENPKHRFAQIVSYLTDLLQGTPSVIIGIVIYIWVVVPMKGYSAIAGSAALFVMMLPLIIRSTEETLKILPASLKEAGLALGGSKASVMLKVQLPAAFGGIFTGVLLAISRVIGETAPLMFTALGCSLIRFSIDKPISAVPLLIWEFFNDPNLQDLIWGASLFLLLFVLTLNLTAKYLAKKWNQ